MRPLLVFVAGKDPLEEPGGGHSVYVRACARAAVRAGYAPQILCVGATARVRETDFGTIRRLRSPFRPLRQLMIPGHAPILARGLVTLAAARPGPVLAHGFGVWGAAAVDGCARLRRRGRTAVAVIGSYTTYRVESDSLVRGLRDAPVRVALGYRAQAAWARAVVHRYERAAYRGAARVFVNYESVRRLVLAEHGPTVRVERVAYGPESAFLPPPEPGAVPAEIAVLRPAGAPLVVSVARSHSRKGVDVLVDALALARDRGTPLRACLIGEGPLLADNRRRARALGLDGAVVLAGRVAEVEPYLRRADVFALASREEQSGALALLEALRAGLPIAASAVDGIPEDVRDGESALLVPPGDAPALASALVRLAADAALRRRLAAGAAAVYATRFAAEPFAASLGAAYAALGFPPS
ncbi:MAG: glycosyltransferase [bacterium]|nr:glycosyltransferase [bacterium]